MPTPFFETTLETAFAGIIGRKPEIILGFNGKSQYEKAIALAIAELATRRGYRQRVFPDFLELVKED